MIVCMCRAVPRGCIEAAVDAGASSVECVERACGAGSDCGSCREEVAEIIRARHPTAGTRSEAA